MKKRLFISVVAFVLMFGMVSVVMSDVAYAAISNVDVDGVVLNGTGSNTSSWTKDGTKITCSLSWGVSSATATLNITNSSSEAKQVSFDYTKSDGSFKITLPDNTTVSSAGTINLTLQPEAVIKVEVTRSSFGKASFTITNFAVKSASSLLKVNLKAAENGSYTATTSGGSTVNVQADTTLEVKASDEVTLTAMSDEGYKFYCWKIGDEYHYAQTTKVSNLPDGTNIQVAFIPQTYNLAYQVNGVRYWNWEDAMTAANGSGTVILVADHELPADPANNKGEKTGTYVTNVNNKLVYKLPKGVTFLIPYDSTLSTSNLTGRGDVSQSGYSSGSAYRTLTVSESAVVNVEGTFVVNAKRSIYKTSKQGVTSGTYGKMILAGTMNVKNGAELIVRGYIVDRDHETHTYSYGQKGKLIAESGSNVRILFQLMDFRGGSATSAVKDDVVPITSYSIQNIMMYTEYQYGATLKAEYYAVVSSQDTFGTAQLLSKTDSDECLFIVGSDAVVIMDYNYQTDQMYVCIPNGKVAFSGITVAPKAEGILGGIAGALLDVKIKTSDTQLPIADNLQVFIGGYPNEEASTGTPAEVTIRNPVKMLPGSMIHILGNGIATIPQNSALYVYDTNYNAAWGNSALRTGLDIQEVHASYRGKQQKPTANAQVKIYSGATGIIEGTLAQYDASGEGSKPALSIFGENATLTIGEKAVIEKNSIASIYETSSTTGVATEISSWDSIKGPMYGLSENDTDYKYFSEIGAGTYKTIRNEKDSGLYWYKYTVTYNVTGIGGEVKTYTRPISTNSTTFNPTLDLADLEAGDQKYVIVAASTGAAGTDDPNAALNAVYGWENLVLDNITTDMTVDVKVMPYQYRVKYTENGETASAVEYVSDTYTKTWEAAPMLITPVFKNWDASGNISPVYEQTENEAGTAFKVTLTEDTQIDLTTVSDLWKVTWTVTNPDNSQETGYKLVEKGKDWVYNVPQPDNSWWIIDSDSEEATNLTVSGSHGGVVNDGTSCTIKAVNSELTVDIKLTAYDHLLLVSLLVPESTDASNVQIAPRYFNGDTVTVDHKEITAQDQRKYIFEAANNITCTGANASATKDTLTITNATEKQITVEPTVQRYDAVVTINQNGTQIHNDYYSAGDEVSYSFSEDVKIESYKVNGTSSSYDNPDMDENGNVTNAKITYTVGTTDATLDVTTKTFDHILKVNDGAATVKTVYLTGGTYEYECDPYRYISAATTTSGTASGENEEKLTVSGITDNAFINITLQEFARKVSWYNVDTKEVLKTEYILEIPEGGASAVYECGDKQVAWAQTYANSLQFTSDQGKRIEATNIQAVADDPNGSHEKVEIGLQLYDYDYEVTFADGTNDTVYYVKNDKNVLNTGNIVYNAAKNKYVTGCSVAGNEPAIEKAGDNANDTAAELNGYRYLKLTEITSDVTVNLNLADYDYKVTWTVKISKNGESQQKKVINYIVGDTATYQLDEGYTITEITPASLSASGVGTNTATISGISQDIAVTVDARDYLYEIEWKYNGTSVKQTVEADDVQDDGYVQWKIPADVPSNYVVTGAAVTNGTATYTNKTVKVKRNADADLVTVSITLEEALTDYTALWGDMAFEYYKNSAVYSLDEEDYTWKLIDQYAWRHKNGSRIHVYRNLNSQEIDHYTVPHGSVMIVNPTNQKIRATITIDVNADADIWADTPVVTLETENGTQATRTIEVTLDAHKTMLVSATLSGTPKSLDMVDQVTGSYNAVIEPID